VISDGVHGGYEMRRLCYCCQK